MSESRETSPFRDNPAEIARFLTEALTKDDLAVFLQALKAVMRAQNVSALARATGLEREPLYRTFGGEIEPLVGRVLTLLEGMDVKLVAMPRENPKAKPRPPKLGRPRSFKRNKDKHG